MFKVNNRNTNARYEICAKLTIKTPERRHRQWHCSGVFIVKFKHISHLVLVFLLISEGQELISSLKFAEDFLVVSGCIKLKNWAEMDKEWSWIPVGVYLFTVNNKNTKTICKICSKIIIKTPERRQWRRSGVFIVDFKQFNASWDKAFHHCFQDITCWNFTY